MELDIQEALRYLSVKGPPDPALLGELRAAADRLTQSLRPQYTYRVFPITAQEDGIGLEGTDLTLTGAMADRMLSECQSAALLLCTLGARFEAMLRAEQARDMARAVLLDACGSAWVEAGCDAAEAEITARFPEKYLTDRFSPGYGDLPLALQPAVCAALDGWRRLGVQVTESLLLNPTKSVTAVIGLSDRPQPARVRGCAFCSMNETCQLRKRGTNCGL